MAALLLVAFSVPVMAEVKVGGIVFTDFYYLGRNGENATAYGLNKHNESYGNTRLELNPLTRLNARWTNEDNVGMFIEMNLGSKDNTATSVGFRHAYGWWDITPQFQLLAGHTSTPFSPLNPSQLLGLQSGSGNVIGDGYGDIYSHRMAQIRASFNFSKAFAISIAMADPNGGTDVAPSTDYQMNTKIPRFDMGAHVNVGPVKIYPSFMWQQKTADKFVISTIDDSLGTYVGSLGVKLGMGPFIFSAEGNYGKNLGNAALGTGGSQVARNMSATVYRAPGSTDAMLDDTTGWGYWVDLAFKFGPVTPHLIFGQAAAMGDQNPMSYRSTMYGVSVPIALAKGFKIRPEFMWYDDGDNNTPNGGGQAVDKGSYGIYGVQFQVTF